jgi:hypothetical protein
VAGRIVPLFGMAAEIEIPDNIEIHDSEFLSMRLDSPRRV